MILSNPDVLSLYLHVALLTQHVVACDQNKSILTALSLGLSPLVDCVKSPLLSVDDEQFISNTVYYMSVKSLNFIANTCIVNSTC